VRVILVVCSVICSKHYFESDLFVGIVEINITLKIFCRSIFGPDKTIIFSPHYVNNVFSHCAKGLQVPHSQSSLAF
jgi:hypothetical protein